MDEREEVLVIVMTAPFGKTRSRDSVGYDSVPSIRFAGIVRRKCWEGGDLRGR